MRKRLEGRLIAGAAAVASMVSGAAGAGDLERGAALHDTFCIMCHSPELYGRDDRVANNYMEVRQQVERWQGNAKLRWSAYDIESVSDYLAEKYYKVAR